MILPLAAGCWEGIVADTFATVSREGLADPRLFFSVGCHDYVIRMTKDELPPAQAFWSLTLYDLDQGFFIPNDRKKYSVGENAGMKLNADGGIEIYVAAEQPSGVPAENWLPIERKDMDLNLILRIYVPDLERMKTWAPPKAEKVESR